MKILFVIPYVIFAFTSAMADEVTISKFERSDAEGNLKLRAIHKLEGAEAQKVLEWVGRRPWRHSGRKGYPAIPLAGVFVVTDKRSRCIVVSVVADEKNFLVNTGVRLRGGVLAISLNENPFLLKDVALFKQVLPLIEKYNPEGIRMIESQRR